MEMIIELDKQLFQLINSGLTNPLFDLFLVPFRHKMFWIPLYLFLISFIGLNYSKKSGLIFIFIILTIATSDLVSSQLIKKSVQRTRPCNLEQFDVIQRIPCSPGYSFTSSHATNHFAIGSFLFFLFSFFKHNYLFLFWAGIVGFAQIYVGVHFPVDVIVGSCIGFIIGFTLFKFYNTILNYFITTKQLL